MMTLIIWPRFISYFEKFACEKVVGNVASICSKESKRNVQVESFVHVHSSAGPQFIRDSRDLLIETISQILLESRIHVQTIDKRLHSFGNLISVSPTLY
jgi:hypothetical protein